MDGDRVHTDGADPRAADDDGAARAPGQALVAAPVPPKRHRFHWFRDVRAWIHARPHLHFVYRVLVGIVGGLVIIIGLALVPLPGPGWLVVFIGLTILSSEFAFFHRISTWLRRKLHDFWDRVRRHAPSSRVRAAADRGKASVDAAHDDAHRSMGASSR
ncbi:TIGR02611 family protein [Curtobacterium sp. MCBD17_028]|uniref:TIGR02611 family protein n=1 Tax=Curtobacterium sp. MCBD17_028 TaxID=2175670 RepID=UPI000DA99717|nr:TIGR02611 family protein [Curtobacterium sp. MCBD17_028]PZE23349.1 TIGR02611 family protein [Curtobacterium sp. MCBD17_028]